MSTQTFLFDRVMIVDDTKIDRYIASTVMKKHFFSREIMEFDMATKAIMYLEENQNNPQMLPQVTILDVRMPEMDGFQFLEKLSQLPAMVSQSCCIIMLSSSLDPSDLERAQQNAIVKMFLNKPLNKTNLEQIRQLYLQSQKQGVKN